MKAFVLGRMALCSSCHITTVVIAAEFRPECHRYA